MTLRHVCAIAIAAFGISLAASAEPDAKIVRTWKAKCASCHGVDGKAKTDTGEKLGIPDLTAKKPADDAIKKAIVDGVPAKPGKAEGMDGYKDKLTPEQIDGLVEYVKTLK